MCYAIMYVHYQYCNYYYYYYYYYYFYYYFYYLALVVSRRTDVDGVL